jgi:alkylation response protein AidB-like acyl-CoA dehydrogenase
MMQLDEFRASVDEWIDGNLDALTMRASGLDAEVEHLNAVKRLAYDAGWIRYGWPERVGGLGGTSLLRAYLGQALTGRGLVPSGAYSMAEVLLPTLIAYAPPELAAEMIPRHLSGQETWCQGFSEPNTGSNLGALSCRATRDGDEWVVNGQKVWTSYAQYAQRCVLLARTGTQESAHRGITALFVDMDSPGITVRPIHSMHGADEFCEVFFDDVRVPVARMLGHEGQGWAVAMDLLPFERSTALWHRIAFLLRRANDLLDRDCDPYDLGDAVLHLYALRARSRRTQYRLHDGKKLGPATSVDKVLMATAEQALFDVALDATDLADGDDPDSQEWRTDYMYSRSASIYGGTGEIQRNIIARRLLELGDD